MVEGSSAMRVKHLSLTNFRGFEKLELDLDRPVTVLVGVNGSGKTSVLRAISAVGDWLSWVCGSMREPLRVALDARDLRAGSTRGEVIFRTGHQYCSEMLLSWTSRERGWQWSVPEWVGRAPHPVARPFVFLVSTDRHVNTADVRSSPSSPHTGEAIANGAHNEDEDEGAIAPHPGYARFIEWFKNREDVENARRVANRDFDLQDVELRAVREAVAALMPDFDELRIDREVTPPAMVVTKGDVELRLDQLSDGERNLIALAGDLARRMAIANPGSDSPLETEGVILIDEIEQHLHPALQRKVIPSLQRAFPKAQLIVTTHSPQVLSSVPASAIVVLDGFDASPVTSPTRGRDTNAILREVFGVPERPPEQAQEVLDIVRLIDGDRLDEARSRLASLAELLSEHDGEVLRLRTKIDFAAVGL